MTQVMDRSGQVAVIVGGTGAIGGAIARRLAEEGADIAFSYGASAAKAAQLSSHVESLGRRSYAASIKNEDAKAVAAFMTAVVADFGRIDTLVYASGPSFPLSFVSAIGPEDWARVFAADVNGCFFALGAALPHLRASRGSFVAITAAGVERALARDVLSLAPKSAITTLVRTIALEEGRNGVRANCVAPGFIDAGLGASIMEAVGAKGAEALVGNVPLRRAGTVEDVADAVSFVSSGRASYITGTTLFVSGGMEL